jgi:hypothetical protein
MQRASPASFASMIAEVPRPTSNMRWQPTNSLVSIGSEEANKHLSVGPDPQTIAPTLLSISGGESSKAAAGGSE